MKFKTTILILMIFSVISADFRVKRDVNKDKLKDSGLKSFFKKLQTENPPVLGQERLVSDLRERYFCADLSADISGIFKNLWTCEEITEFEVSKNHDFDCKGSFLLIEVVAKLPDPANKTTYGKKVELYLQPRYGLLLQEQQYSDQCIYIKRYFKKILILYLYFR